MQNCFLQRSPFQCSKGEKVSRNMGNRAGFYKKGYSKAGTEANFRAKCGNYFVIWTYSVIFSETRVWSLLSSRFIHSFFKSKAIARRNSSVQILACPQV